MLRESAHSQGLETCAECALQRTPECILLFLQSDHQELGSTVSHPFDKHLYTNRMIVQQLELSLGHLLHHWAVDLEFDSVTVSVWALRPEQLSSSILTINSKQNHQTATVYWLHVPMSSWPLTKHLNSLSGLIS